MRPHWDLLDGLQCCARQSGLSPDLCAISEILKSLISGTGPLNLFIKLNVHL